MTDKAPECPLDYELSPNDHRLMKLLEDYNLTDTMMTCVKRALENAYRRGVNNHQLYVINLHRWKAREQA